MKYLFGSMLVLGLVVSSSFVAQATEKDPCASRVPADQLAAAKAEKNPMAGNAEAIAKGKEIFSGAGTCFTCHGPEGKGDGEAGKALDPTPRNFTNPKFQDCKSDGEMLWIIRNGSPGTGMIPAVTTGIISEDDAKRVQAYVRSLKGK